MFVFGVEELGPWNWPWSNHCVFTVLVEVGRSGDDDNSHGEYSMFVFCMSFTFFFPHTF